MKRIRAILATALLGLGGIMTAPAVQALTITHTEEKIDLGAAPLPNTTTLGTTVNGAGTPIGVVVSGGAGGVLNIIDLKTRANIASHVLDDSARNAGEEVHAWGYVTLSNGHVMIATSNAGLYDVDPQNYQVKKLSSDDQPGYKTNKIKENGKFFWDITKDDNDKVYIASFSNNTGAGGRVFTYDGKATGDKWGDLLGQISPDQTTARSVAYDNGTLYIGMGQTRPEIIAVNTKNPSEKRTVPLENSAVNGTHEILYLEALDGRLYSTVDSKDACKGTGTCVIDAANGKVSDTLQTWSSRTIKRAGEKSKVYYIYNSGSKGGILREYDPGTKSTKDLNPNGQLAPRLGRNSWATDNVLLTNDMNSGAMTVYDSGNVSNLPTGTLKGSERGIQTLTTGPDGNIYGGFYMSGTQMLKITTSGTPKAELLDGMPTGQVEGFANVGNKLVAGIYPGARLSVFDPGSGQWTVQDKAVDSALPKGTREQDRPYAMTAIDNNRVAVGTVPNKDKVGGALVIFNPQTGAFEDNPIVMNDSGPAELRNLSPVSMAYRDDKLYVGTSIRGGLGVQPKASEAKLFVYNVKSKQIEKVATIPGTPTAINALTFDDSGKLYGVAGKHIHEFNPTTLESVRSSDDVITPDANRSQLHYKDGILYTATGNKVLAVNASDFKDRAELVSTDPKTEANPDSLTLDKDGNLYYSKRPNIYKITVTK